MEENQERVEMLLDRSCMVSMTQRQALRLCEIIGKVSSITLDDTPEVWAELQTLQNLLESSVDEELACAFSDLDLTPKPDDSVHEGLRRQFGHL
jgi:hypothetical protein